MEMRGTGNPRASHLPESYDFRSGKLYPKAKSGLGVEFDPSAGDLVAEVTEQDRPISLYRWPDGSITNR